MKKKFIFCGDRKYVLEEMLKLNLNVQILVIKNSYLHRQKNLWIKRRHKIIESFKELYDYLNNNNFDIFISNGCPFFLPISVMKKKIYVNIHPSYLPSLKGIDPAIGSILFKKNGGATAHIMNDKLDSGDIISQVKIPYSNDLNATLMYQLIFFAEKKVFLQAYKSNFISKKSMSKKGASYYSRQLKDRFFNKKENINKIINRVKSFSNKSQGVLFKCNNQTFKIYDAQFIKNKFLTNLAKKFKNFQIITKIENFIYVKIKSSIVKFTINDNADKLKTNDIIDSYKNFFNDIKKSKKNGFFETNDKTIIQKILIKYLKEKYQFNFIGSVILGIQKGNVYVNSLTKPSSAFIIHKFGWSQLIGKKDKKFLKYLRNFIFKDKTYKSNKIRNFTTSNLSMFKSKESQIRKRGKYILKKIIKIKKPLLKFKVREINVKNIHKISKFLPLKLNNRFWDSKEHFVKNSFGYFAEFKGKPISICYSCANFGIKREIDIYTSEKFRLKGVGKYLAYLFIKECQKKGFEPCWDCFSNNKASNKTAKSLGFVLYKNAYNFVTINK